MFKIGDLGRLAQVSVKTLRYYGERGLLKPVWIDRYTGYRYYATEQLGRLNRILALKELGFSLDEIGRLLDESITTDELRGMLRLRHAQLERSIATERARLLRVDARLRHLDREGCESAYPVLIKAIEPQRVLAVSGPVEGFGRTDTLRARLLQALRQCGDAGAAAGTMMAMYAQPPGDEALQAEVAVACGPALRMRAGDNEDLCLRSWQAAPEAAATLHHGDPANIAEAHGALLRWASEGGYRPISLGMEVYIHGPQENLAPEAWLTEVRLPVESITGSFDAHQKERLMNPEIVTLPAFTAIGQVYRGKNEQGEIPAMWDELNTRWAELEALQQGSTAYGVCREMEPDGVFEYLAGVGVAPDALPPAGMARWDVPAQTYAVFPCKLATIHLAYEQAYQVWLPTSGYQRAPGPDFELYPETFEPENLSAQEMFVYIPITR